MLERKKRMNKRRKAYDLTLDFLSTPKMFHFRLVELQPRGEGVGCRIDEQHHLNMIIILCRPYPRTRKQREGIDNLKEKAQYQSTIDMNPTAPPKEVAFQDDNSISLDFFGITDDEKQMVWYTLKEIDEFKADAARDACVRLFHPQETTSSPSSDEQTAGHEASLTVKSTNKFVTVGNFDEKIEEDKSIATDAATCSTRRKCTNEFSHMTDTEGTNVYMRGLGFHFSRYRKRTKVAGRTSVLKWAKIMNSIALQKDPIRDKLPLHLVKELDKERREKANMVLAKLSEKCSKEERHRALWRGKLDHQMAYPKNYTETFFHNGIVSSASSENTSESESKKRMPVSDEGDQQQTKRRSIG